LDGDIVEVLEFSILDKASDVRPWQRGGLPGLQQHETQFDYKEHVVIVCRRFRTPKGRVGFDETSITLSG